MAAPAAALLAKTCSKCGETKPLDVFRLRKGARDGRHGWCNSCYNAYYSTASREWRAANRERDRANKRRVYAENTGRERARKRRYDEANRELVNQRAREYYETHRDVRVEVARQYREQNRELIRARQRARHAANPAVYRLRAERRYELERGATAELVAHVAHLLTQSCAYCGSHDRIEIDHVVPLSRGGRHEASNLAPACLPCNRSKGRKLLSEWRDV